MKGGSATKILLETIFLTSMLQMELNERYLIPNLHLILPIISSFLVLMWVQI